MIIITVILCNIICYIIQCIIRGAARGRGPQAPGEAAGHGRAAERDSRGEGALGAEAASSAAGALRGPGRGAAGAPGPRRYRARAALLGGARRLWPLPRRSRHGGPWACPGPRRLGLWPVPAASAAARHGALPRPEPEPGAGRGCPRAGGLVPPSRRPQARLHSGRRPALCGGRPPALCGGAGAGGLAAARHAAHGPRQRLGGQGLHGGA